MSEEDFFAMVISGLVVGTDEDRTYTALLHRHGYVKVDLFGQVHSDYYDTLVLKPFKIVENENTLWHYDKGDTVVLNFDTELV